MESQLLVTLCGEIEEVVQTVAGETGQRAVCLLVRSVVHSDEVGALLEVSVRESCLRRELSPYDCVLVCVKDLRRSDAKWAATGVWIKPIPADSLAPP